MNTRSHALRGALLGILCLIIAAGFSAAMYFKPLQAAQAASITDKPELGALAPDGWGYRSCVITDVLTDANFLIMVVCNAYSPSGVDRFAIKGDAAHQIFADRALVLLNTAYALDVSISLSYDEFTTANPTGCSSINCRALTSVKLSH
jgi:hypothetical protein